MGRRQKNITTIQYRELGPMQRLLKEIGLTDTGDVAYIIDYSDEEERGTISRMEPAGHSSATPNIVVPHANPPQPPAVREDGATLSPPNTWSSSSVEFLDDDNDNRLLFTCTFTLPHGTVLSSSSYVDKFDESYLSPGANFLTRLEPKGQSFILSASTASVKQRIFARVTMPDGQLRACELLCEFEPERAKITVLALRSAFAPTIHGQGFHTFTFITKHSSTCALTHIDYASIPYLGLLPTDLIGKSLLAFVYAPDVHVVRQAHIDLQNSKGKIVKSIAELRLVAHNGSILRCQTEWSAYLNPWSRKIELVVARHRILGLPIGDADVLSAPPIGSQIHTLPPVMAKTFEDELRTIMNKPVPSTSTSTSRHHHLKEHPLSGLADIGIYIDKLVEHLVVNSTAQQQQKYQAAAVVAAAQAAAVQAAAVAATSSQIRNVVSAPPAPTASSDPPLSYTQINCLENVHRLLKSQSRPESPAKQDEPFDEKKYPPTKPLTRDALEEHTKKFENEYKDTWCRRLKRLSDDVPSSPPPTKVCRPAAAPLHWNLQQKQEFYRSLAPAPPPPPGKNYQITYTPLDDPIDEKSSNNTKSTKSDVENIASPTYITIPTASKFSTPMRLSIDGNSTPPRLLMPVSSGSPTSGSQSPPVFPKTPSSSSLLILRESSSQ